MCSFVDLEYKSAGCLIGLEERLGPMEMEAMDDDGVSDAGRLTCGSKWSQSGPPPFIRSFGRSVGRPVMPEGHV